MKLLITSILLVFLSCFALNSMGDDRVPLQLVIVGNNSPGVAYVRCKVLDAKTHAQYSTVNFNAPYAENDKTDNHYIEYQLSEEAILDTNNPVTIACDLFSGSNQKLDSDHVNGQCEAQPNPSNMHSKIPCRMSNWDPS